MGHVREICSARFQFGDVSERLIEPQMRRMLLEPQTIEHQYVKTAQPIHRVRWNLTQIRSIGKIVKAVSHHRQTAVNQFQRSYFQVLAQTKRRAGKDGVRNHLRQAAPKIRRVKDVFEDASNVQPRLLVGVNTKGAVAKIQGPDVVQAKD